MTAVYVAHLSVQYIFTSHLAKRSTIYFKVALSRRPYSQSSNWPVSRSSAFQIQSLLRFVLPEFAVHRHLRTRTPCIDGVSFPKRLTIHRYMHRVILVDTKPIEL